MQEDQLGIAGLKQGRRMTLKRKREAAMRLLRGEETVRRQQKWDKLAQ